MVLAQREGAHRRIPQRNLEHLVGGAGLELVDALGRHVERIAPHARISPSVAHAAFLEGQLAQLAQVLVVEHDARYVLGAGRVDHTHSRPVHGNIDPRVHGGRAASQSAYRRHGGHARDSRPHDNRNPSLRNELV